VIARIIGPSKGGEASLVIKVAVNHPSCGDLTSLQWSVGHSVEPVGGLVLEEIAALCINVVSLDDSEGAHVSGVGACELMVLPYSVVLFELKILAEEEPVART
jgi:hypothetical protein